MRLRFLALPFILAACASGPGQRDIPGKITHLPDGSQGYVITCGAFSDMTDCVKRAGDICVEKGYTVIEKTKETGARPVLMTHRGMTIRCNTPDGLYPADEPVSPVSP